MIPNKFEKGVVLVGTVDKNSHDEQVFEWGIERVHTADLKIP